MIIGIITATAGLVTAITSLVVAARRRRKKKGK
jgi:lipid-A-disaccharide synthase-like uncharacterized protein